MNTTARQAMAQASAGRKAAKRQNADGDLKGSKRTALEDISNRGAVVIQPEPANKRVTRNASKQQQHQMAKAAHTLLNSDLSDLNLNSPTMPISPSPFRELPERVVTSSRQQILAQAHATPESLPIDAGADEDNYPHPPPATFIDIDAADGDDPLLCTTYVQDVYDYLRQTEERYCPSKMYMENQKEITPRMRSILVDWLVDVTEEYHLTPETLFLTVNYLDRYLSSTPTTREELQLIGMVCSFIASKFEEVHPPLVDDYIFISDYAYNREQIVMAESRVLTALKFNLCAPTHRNFLRRYLKAAQADAKTRNLTYYLTELTLVDHNFASKYPPSLVACAAVCLALHTLGMNAWTSTYEHYSRYSTSDPEFQACLRELHALHKGAAKSAYQSIREKYSHSPYMKVSLIPPLP